MKDKLPGLIGKRHEDLEDEFGFDYYLETKDDFLLGRKVDSKKLVDAFLKFNKNFSFTVIKLYGGDIQEFSEMNIEPVKENLFLSVQKKGLFYDDSDDESATTYGFLCEDYFAEIMEGIIFFFGKEKAVYDFAKILDEHGLEYHEPSKKGEFKRKIEYRKLGRNEPCHCGSGTKYKKCCLNKDIKETGKPKKVKMYY